MGRLLRRLTRDTPLSLRLTALYVAILAVVLATLGFVLYDQVEGFLIRDTHDRLVAGANAAITRRPPNRGRPSAVPDIQQLAIVTRELTSDDQVAVILDKEGVVLAGGQDYPDQPTPPTCSAADLQHTLDGNSSVATINGGGVHQLVLLTPVALGNGSTGVLQVTASLAAADDLLERLRSIILFGSLGAIVLGTLLGVSVTRTALRPLAKVTATSERIAAGDLSQRTDLPGGRDEIGRLSSAFDHMVDRLEGALRAQRQFVADASHELRTPLTALGGLVEMLLLGADRGDTATTQRALRSAHREIERLARLVGDLLTLSRLDARPDVEHRPVDLAVLVAEVGEQARFLAGERAVTWRVDGPLTLAGDRDKLKQVLLNLTGNAIAFTGETGRIELRAARLATGRGDSARIEVEDNGAGIAPSELPRLFERFYRGDKSRARRADGGGNGLGLAIARAIVEAHGGTIAARSTLGQGTTFTIELPFHRANQVDANPRPLVSSASTAGAGA
ncbi:MAG: ATP-binding protein [Thermomicrobiales bacterium]